jgi:integrase/recombinase XerC
MQENKIPVIKEFIDYLNYEKHFSPHTIKCYSADLRQFTGYLAGQQAPGFGAVTASSGLDDPGQEPTDSGQAYQSGIAQDNPVATALAVETLPSQDISAQILKVDTNVLRAFLAYLNEQNYSRTTSARKLATLRSFYKFTVRRGYIQTSPVATIRTPKQEKRLPRCLEPEQINVLLNCPETSNMLGARDRAIMETLYSSGLRVSELVGLDLSDVNFLGEVLHLRGKGKKERMAPVGASALQAIQRYLTFRDTESRNRDKQNSESQQQAKSFDKQALFINKHGQRLSTRSVRRKLDKYLRQAGLDPRISPHTLRHSFATHMLNNGADLRMVQELLGHRSLSTTQVYTHLTTSKMKTVYDNSHPRSIDDTFSTENF